METSYTFFGKAHQTQGSSGHRSDTQAVSVNKRRRQGHWCSHEAELGLIGLCRTRLTVMSQAACALSLSRSLVGIGK